MSEENQQLKRIIEGAILAAGEPLSIAKLQSLFEEEQMPGKEALLDALAEIKDSCEGRGFDLIEVASGWRFQVREDVAQWVNRLWEEKPQKYSRALLETLALIAYRQPLTRGDIEEVRGVAVSSHIIKTLTERDWVKVVGHRDVPGRPALYATTKAFLDYFNLNSLEQLPTLGELKDIDGLNKDLEFGELDQNATQDQGTDVDQESENEAETPVASAADETPDAELSDDGSSEDGNVPDTELSDDGSSEDGNVPDTELSDDSSAEDDDAPEAELPDDNPSEDEETIRE